MPKNKWIILAGMMGNALEWFDFLLYSYFASLLAELFFPARDHFLSLAMSLSALALGFLVRPIGAFFMGYCGDRYGRKAILLTTILLMTIPTCAMGLLPTYQQIGVLAPLLLLTLRVLQGLAVSGELNNTASFLIEHSEPHQSGFAGSLAMCSAIIGICFGAVYATVLYFFLTPEAIHAWGWRIAFLSASVLGFIGFWVRCQVPESPKFLSEKSENPKLILKTLFKNNRNTIFLSLILTLAMAVQNYFLFTFFTVYLHEVLGYSSQQSMLLNVIAMSGLIFAIPLMGWLSDKIGRRELFIAGLIGMILCVLPIMWLLQQKNVYYALVGETLFALLTAPIAGLIPTMLVELFPTAIRNTGTSLGYNLSLALFGGTTPLVAMMLIHYTGSNYAPAFYLMGACVISMITAILFFKPLSVIDP